MLDRQLKLLLLTHAGGSPHHGPNMRWYYLGQALQAKGIDVEVVSASWFHKYINPPKVTATFTTQNIDGLTYHWIRTAPYKGRGVWQVINQAEFVARCFFFATQLSQRRPNIVVASSPHPFVAYPAVQIARKAKARFFYEVRDLWPAILLELGAFGPHHPYIIANRAAERYAVRHAEKVLSVKPGDYDYFADQYGLAPERFQHVPNGFLPDTNNSSAPPVISRLRSRYKFLVGYAGAISAYYQLEDMVDLAASFRDRPEVGFIAVGGGEREATIRERAEALRLSNFHMIGKISKAQIPATLDQFDVCYVGLVDLDIHKYGISCNKLYEYMFAAKPVLGSYVAGYDPLAESGCGLTARPGDTAALKAALERLLADANFRTTLGQRGKVFFDTTHHFTRVADLLIEKVLTNPC